MTDSDRLNKVKSPAMETVFVYGRFNVLHPGHVRLLQYARAAGDKLIVGVEPDSVAGNEAHVPEDLRLEGVRSCSYVDEAFIMTQPATKVIGELRPAIVVKGSEHRYRHNDEKAVIDSYGGKLLFSSGEMVFTSRDLIRREFSSSHLKALNLPLSFMNRHGIASDRLEEVLSRFEGLRVVVLGDMIIDEYISCDPLGMSQEDPTLVVKPVDTSRFVGGAGIVAAHARALGGHSTLFSVVGRDDEAVFAHDFLANSGVRVEFYEDTTRPTTLKTRYRCQGKTLLRVSRLQQTSIAGELARQIVEDVRRNCSDASLVVFSDFNYGALPQEVVDEITKTFKASSTVLCADSQSSSQFGDVSRFQNMDLLTPTEREARLSMKNISDGLNVLAEKLRLESDARHVILKLGQEGALVCPSGDANQNWSPDQIEALNKDPRDVAGAGDSMLVVSGMALAVGASIWEAACLGSIAAAIQVGRLGNTAISMDEMLASLSKLSH